MTIHTQVPDLSLPVPLPRDEPLVRRTFWKKLRKVAGRVPFADDAAAAYYCAIDPATPAKVKATLFAALAYFVLPFDAIPDFLAGIGFTDDAAVLLLALTMVARHVTDAHRARARAALLIGEPAA